MAKRERREHINIANNELMKLSLNKKQDIPSLLSHHPCLEWAYRYDDRFTTYRCFVASSRYSFR